MAPRIVQRRRAALAGAATMAGCLSAAGPAAAVVGGEAAAGPLAAASVMVLSSKGGVCTGIVLAPTVVLTAAHCASGASDHRVHYKADGSEPVLIGPAQVVLHPGYDRGAIAGRRRSIDLALIRLPDPLPRRFDHAALTAGAVAAGNPVTLGGFGVAREGDARSTGTFREATLSVVEPHGRSTVLVWARGRGGAGACQGDSGGPIAAPDGAVLAVTTWASGAARRKCGDLSQGVLVGPQRSWIDATLGRWSVAAQWR